MTLSQADVDLLVDRIIAEIRRRGPDPLALSEPEAARAIGISVRSLFDLRKSLAIEHVKVGNRVIYPIAGIRRFLEERAEQAAQQPK